MQQNGHRPYFKSAEFQPFSNSDNFLRVKSTLYLSESTSSTKKYLQTAKNLGNFFGMNPVIRHTILCKLPMLIIAGRKIFFTDFQPYHFWN